jgi:hypothetical protein
MKDRNLEGKERRYGLLSGRGAGYERMCCRLSKAWNNRSRCCLEWRRKTPSSAFEKEQDIAKQGKYWEDGHDGHERMRAADNWGNI